MSNRSPKSVRCDNDLWSRFEEFVYEQEGQTNGAKPKHLENALREYLDEGRDARLEKKLDEVLTHVREEPATHTHTSDDEPSTAASPAVETAREIAERIHRNLNDEGNIPNADVERAIEDIGGADPRTVRRYKKRLKRRELLYKHPGAKIWTAERASWLNWVEDYMVAHPDLDLHDLTEEYDMSVDEYDQAVEQVLDQ